MAGTNQFLAFATGTGANVLTPSAYAALTALVAQGFQSGVAPSQQVNTPIRQSTFVVAALAQLIADYGLNANDDGDLTTFKNNFSQAIALPRGSMILWPTATPPSGFLALNGAAISRTTYAFLYSLFNTTYGSGDGSTTFNLPDYRNRAPVGYGSLYAIAATGGSKDAIVISHNHSVTDPGHAHSISDSGHNHSVNDPGHQHSVLSEDNIQLGTMPGATAGQRQISNGDLGGRANFYRAASNSTGITNSASYTGITGSNTGYAGISSTNSTGASGTNANMMPYLASNFIIKY
jgi:microcystin-dependent protein